MAGTVSDLAKGARGAVKGDPGPAGTGRVRRIHVSHSSRNPNIEKNPTPTSPFFGPVS